MASVLEQTRAEIERRLSELAPLVAEYERLQAADQALAGIPASRERRAAATRRRKRGRPRGSSSTVKSTAAKAAKPAGRRPGRRKGSGGRAAEALRLVEGQPGITMPELASAMGIKQNYLYRVMPALQRERKVRKQGRGWHPAGS